MCAAADQIEFLRDFLILIDTEMVAIFREISLISSSFQKKASLGHVLLHVLLTSIGNCLNIFFFIILFPCCLRQ